MLLFNPLWVNDLGFILSFAATYSILLFDKPVKALLTKLQVTNLLKEDLSTSLSAQVGVAPIIYFTFGQFNLFSPLINAAVLWTIAPITIIGMIAGMISIVCMPLGRLILFLVYPLTFWFVEVVNFASGIF